MAAPLLMFMLIFSAIVAHSSGTWCICKGGINDATLQKTLDYACGAGADCNPTRQNGPCFNPNTVRAHCNYAVNSYFQRNRQAPMACDFSGTASIVTSDPSTTGCAYPTSTSASGTTTSPVTTTPTTPNTGTPITTTPNGGSPFVTTPTNGIIGGNNNGLGPSGTTTDLSGGGILLGKLHLLLAFSGVLVLWWV